MGWLTSLFGSSKSVDKVVETAAKGIYNGIDMIFYTDEEKAKAREKAGDLFFEFTKVAYDQNQIRSVTRRWLAFIIIGPMMFFFILSGLAFQFNEEFATHLFNLFTVLVPWGGGILAFYFGSHIIGALKK